MAERRKAPLILDVEDAALPEAPSPADAPPLDQPVATERLLSAASRGGGWGLGKWVFSVLGALVLLWVGVALTEFITSLFANYVWLGWVGAGLLGLLSLLLFMVCLRELAALSRIGRVEGLRKMAERAVTTGSREDADAVREGLNRLYRKRADLQWTRERLATADDDTPDAEGRIAVAERTLMATLDQRAQASVSRAARDVAAATALIPLALVDVLAALTCNLRMIREIAEIYGGRAGWFGSWRLLRAVAAHLVATGAVAVADDILGPMVGGGVLAKVSRRFGEGAVNGALTARVGVAAMEICRPLPFHALDRPKASALILSALSSWRRGSKSDPA